MDEPENGILASVSGEFIAAGIRELPRPGPDEQQPSRVVVVEGVRDLGAVRITYLLNSYRRGKTRLWHWVAVRADMQTED